MGMYFFKKFSPDTAVRLDNNSLVRFTTLDGLIGYFGTDNDDLAGQFKRFITEQRYGMSEISEEEFHRDYVEPKKKAKAIVPDQRFWTREAMGSAGHEKGINPLASLPAGHVQAKVAVAIRGVMGTHMEDAPADAPLAEVEKPDPKAPPAVKLGTRKKPKTP